MTAREDMTSIRDWFREPDYEPEFSLADMADWLNRRPVAAVERLTAVLGDAVVVPADATEHRVRCRLAWNNWADTPASRREIAASEARDPISAAAWDRVIAALTDALAVSRHDGKEGAA